MLSTVYVNSDFKAKLMHIKIMETKHSKAVVGTVSEKGLAFQKFKAKVQRESRRHFVLIN